MSDKSKENANARSARYRKKRKETLGKEDFSIWEKNKKKEQRRKLKGDPKKYRKQLKRDRERKRAKKNQTVNCGPNPLPDPSYSTKQSLAKGVKKAMSALPSDTPKKVAVLSSVVGSMTPNSKAKVFNKARRNTMSDKVGRPSFTEFQQQWIMEYLKRPSVSYTCPGRKESIYMGKNAEGVSQYHPKHYLLWFVHEIVTLMNDEITSKLPSSQQFNVSYGSLRRFLKTVKYIRFRQDMPENTCACDSCENLELLLFAIKDCYPDIPTEGSKYIKKVLCNSMNEACVDGNCCECSDGTIFYREVLQSVAAKEEVAYYKWIHGEKYPEKVMKIGTGPEAAEELSVQTQAFQRHNYSRIRQHAELVHLKSSLPGTNVAIVQVDFSENYSNTQKNEIQSAYFGHENFTLYTVCTWYAEGEEVKCKTFCIISDCMSHDKFLALHFNNIIIEKVRQLVLNLDEVHFWSDGCAAQFKSKYCFYFLATQYPCDIHITWSFFESHHGKGPVDGVGGKLKSSVYSDVKAGKTVISCAKEFAEYANTRVNATETFYVAEKDVTMPTMPEKVPEVPGTRKVHFIHRTCTNGKNKLTFFLQSQFCEQVSPCEGMLREQLYDLYQNDGGQNQSQQSQVSNCDQNQNDGQSQENGDQNQNGSQVLKDDQLPWKVGEWVIVDYDGNLYPGEVANIIGSNTQVNAMAKTGKNWKWPEVEDLLWYSRDMVKGKISPVLPVCGTRDHYLCNEL